MNSLFAYLSALTPPERATINRDALAARERQTLEVLEGMIPSGGEGATKQEACRRLGMSGAMFDKTCSLLLRTAYRSVVPEGGLTLLEDLHRRGLTPQFRRELGRQERERAGADAAARAEFYRRVFDVVHSRFSMQYDPALAARIGRRWKQLDGGRGAGLYVDACRLGMQVWRAAAGQADPELDARLLRRLRRLTPKIDPDEHPLARYRLNRAWIIYRAQIDLDAVHRQQVLDETITLCRRHRDAIPETEYLAVLFDRAEHEYFFGGSHEVARGMYRRLFDAHPEALERMGYHRTKYLQLCIITGEHSTAEQLLERFHGTDFASPDIGRAKSAALIWAKLRMHQRRYDEARHYIDRAFELNQSLFFVQYAIECRILQTAWFALTGDNQTVEALVPANLKYLRAKGYTLKTSDFYPWFFKITLALIDNRLAGRPLSAALEHKYGQFQRGAAAQYGLLLAAMRGEGPRRASAGGKNRVS